MEFQTRRVIALGPYMVAVLATALAALLRMALAVFFAVEAPFFPFVLSVLFAARHGGLVPGLVATALGAAVGSFLYVQPSLTTWHERSGVAIAAVFFAIMGVTASLLCGALYRAKQRIEEQQQKRVEAERALTEAGRHKDEFLATLAHELRTPLAPIRNAVDALSHAAQDPERIDEIGRLLGRQVGHLSRLVDDLLDISRIAAGKLTLRKERVNLANVLQNAVEAARPVIESSMHEVSVTAESDPIYVHVDPLRLTQVFVNLLTNAAKFTETQGRIWLTASRRGSEVGVAVRDTGIGIASEDLPHVFGRYAQVGAATKWSQGGLGIGLALVKEIVELHGGRVEARSDGLGCGSTFTVYLAVAETPIPQVASPATTANGWLPTGRMSRFNSRTPPPPVRPAV